MAPLVFLIRRLRAAALVLALPLGACTGLLFQPMAQMVRTPADLGLAYRDVAFDSGDGVRLHGWFLPAAGFRGDEGGCTVVFLHGNAENISTHIGSVWWMPANDINVFMVEYRGYGRSEGLPTLGGLHRDVIAGIRAALETDGVDPDRVVVFGQSLGGSLAITALAHSDLRHRVRALAIEGAFADYRRITREKLAEFWLTWPFQWPLSYTIEGDYVPLRDIAELGGLPVLVIHGEADQVVPPDHGEALYAAARGPKELWLVPDAAHIEALKSLGGQRRFVAWLEERC